MILLMGALRTDGAPGAGAGGRGRSLSLAMSKLVVKAGARELTPIVLPAKSLSIKVCASMSVATSPISPGSKVQHAIDPS